MDSIVSVMVSAELYETVINETFIGAFYLLFLFDSKISQVRDLSFKHVSEISKIKKPPRGAAEVFTLHLVSSFHRRFSEFYFTNLPIFPDFEDQTLHAHISSPCERFPQESCHPHRSLCFGQSFCYSSRPVLALRLCYLVPHFKKQQVIVLFGRTSL